MWYLAQEADGDPVVGSLCHGLPGASAGSGLDASDIAASCSRHDVPRPGLMTKLADRKGEMSARKLMDGLVTLLCGHFSSVLLV